MALRSLDRANDDDGILSSINVIPFVDIVLVLLVIFMLTSAAIVRASMKVELPKAASAGATVATTLNFMYTDDGQLFVNGEPTTLAEAARLVRAEADRDPKTQAVISADRDVDYGKVIEIIDMVKQNGVTSFALDVERTAPTTP
jgi:biopolymer transport protein ExbD